MSGSEKPDYDPLALYPSQRQGERDQECVDLVLDYWTFYLIGWIIQKVFL